jgi:5-methylcytosine-specific restriction endonuclease McrBC GTP-binding regulatory subunit McrB
LCDLKADSFKNGRASTYKLKYHGGDEELKPERLQTRLDFLKCDFENRTIKIPPNLSILASMNTSDSSIYYMDSAFKRRWEWEFIDVELNSVSSGENKIAFNTENEWKTFVSKLNEFIKSNHKFIRGIEDKQIGYYFIKFDEYEKIQKSSVKNKLMFFLWDSVFNRDKKPLVKLLFDENSKKELITFGDFVREVDLFITKINNFKNV